MNASSTSVFMVMRRCYRSGGSKMRDGKETEATKQEVKKTHNGLGGDRSRKTR